MTDNPYYVTWDDSLADNDNTQNGSIVDLTFKIDEDASEGDYLVWITYRVGEIYNLDLVDIHFETVAGKITVAIPECEHSFTNYVSDNNATCTADGTKTDTGRFFLPRLFVVIILYRVLTYDNYANT